MSKKPKKKKKKNSRRNRRNKKLKQVATNVGVVFAASPAGVITVGNPVGPYSMGLSKQEEKELEHLADERNRLIKEKQREKFKALPSEVRQQLIYEIEINKLVTDIEETNIEKTQRHQELENRHLPSLFGLGPTVWFGSPGILNRLRNAFKDEG